jgi:hypothetical protein
MATKKTSAKKSAKSNTKAVAKKSTTKKAVAVKERAPNPLHEKLIALMTRKNGATITDFQGVEGLTCRRWRW